jgi:hypothetical protein
MPAAILRFALPQSLLPLACLLHYARPPLEAIVAGSLACSDRMIRVQPKFADLVSADEHVKAERIFSNVKNIAFRPNLQAGR